MNLIALLSSAISESPQTFGEVWYLVATGAISLLVLVISWIVKKTLTQLDKLTTRIENLEKSAIRRDGNMELQMEKLLSRIEHLEYHINLEHKS